uniref:Sodium-dependent multivitamin transporter n=1 Tax=Graphocephala atropunctata TaxID=36148 RepID=A0A1B6LZK8_9HEMI
MMAEQRTLGISDYAVLVVTLLVSLGIGLYFRCTGGKQKTAKEYLLGDRNQSVLPVAVSLMASVMSAVTLLGVSAEVYMYGTIFLTIIVSYVLFTAVAAYLYLPVFFKLEATSAYEYLERRFSRRVRLAASVLYSVQMVLYMGIVLYAPTIALEALTGLSRNTSTLVVGAVCTVYATIGGIKAVIWTDVFQGALMYSALFSVIGMAVWDRGGFSPIWRIAQDHGRIQLFDFTPDPTVRHSTWALFFGGGFTFLSLYAVNQNQVQRYLTMKDHKTAVRSLWFSLPFLYLLLLACGFAGLSIFSAYYTCDPVKSGRISSLDQLMPLYVMDKMGHVHGLSGLFTAGIFSASLSTVSSCVNSLAAVTVEDYLKPLLPRIEATGSTALAKCLVLLYGLACLGVGFLAQHIGGLLQAGLSIMGIAGGPLLGTFTLGMFLPCANEPGALAGIALGIISAAWIGFGQPKPKPTPLPLSTDGCFNMSSSALPISTLTQVQYPFMYRLSYLLYVVIGCCVTLLVGCLVSWLAVYFGYHPPHPISPDLFTPPVARFLQKPQSASEVELQQIMLKESQTKKVVED